MVWFVYVVQARQKSALAGRRQEQVNRQVKVKGRSGGEGDVALHEWLVGSESRFCAACAPLGEFIHNGRFQPFRPPNEVPAK